MTRVEYAAYGLLLFAFGFFMAGAFMVPGGV